MKIFFHVARLSLLAALGLTQARAEAATLPDGLYAEITTPAGILTCELFFEKAPLTVTSFVGLAEGKLGPAPRKPFFDGLSFHRVVPGFVIQGGDPLGTGEGGPGYTFPDEFVAGLRHDAAGILSMANSGPDTNGSQFFLTLASVNRLNYLHSVFGRTVEGLERLSQIKAGDTLSVKIVRRGPAAEKFVADEETFAQLVAGASRATPPAFEDPAGLLQADPPRAMALNTKLNNFARFSHVPFFVRLYEKFEPAVPNQTSADFVAALGRSLPLKFQGALAVWFVAENRWEVFAPGRPDLRPTPAPTAPPLSPPGTADRLLVERQRRMLSGLNEIVDQLIFQLEASPP